MRESARPVLLDGHGHTLRQTCFEKRLLRQDGTGFVELRNVTLTRGGSDGPGAAVGTRSEIMVVDSKVHQNLAEEPGGEPSSRTRTASRCPPSKPAKPTYGLTIVHRESRWHQSCAAWRHGPPESLSVRDA